MKQISNQQLIQQAKAAAKLHRTSDKVKIGEVGCALITDKGNIYRGVSIHASCGIGFCAEHSAIASMVLKREYKIKKIVAVCGDGTILPPCGRCREFMYQIDKRNYEAEIMLGKNRTVKLKALLPEPWQNSWTKR